MFEQEHADIFNKLSDKQAGQLIKAIGNAAFYNVDIKLDKTLSPLAKTMMPRIKESLEISDLENEYDNMTYDYDNYLKNIKNIN